MVHGQHTVSTGRIANDLEIAGLHKPMKITNHVQVGIGAPLAHFMGNNRHVQTLDRTLIVTAKPSALTSHMPSTHPANIQVICIAPHWFMRVIHQGPTGVWSV